MNTALSLWGYEISGKTALISIATYIVVSVLLIYFWPKFSVPWEKDEDGKWLALDIEKRAKLIEARGKVRAAIIQVIGGIVVVAAFVTSIQQIHGSDDAFNQKKADLFAKSVKDLLAEESKDDKRAEALYILSHIARTDRSYHRAVFDAIASFVQVSSEAACAGDGYRSADFRPDRTILRAMRIIGERKRSDDPTEKKLNLERRCYVGLDLRDEWGVVKGLTKARLSDSKMLRIDFGRVELLDAQLMGIDAGDFLNPDWTVEIGRSLHTGDEGDPRTGSNDGSLRRKFVAHFIEANLTNVDFSGAGLQGADFSGAVLKGASFNGAVISRASFKGSQELTAEQLKNTCVGKPDMNEDETSKEQPYFSPKLRDEIRAHPILKGKIPKCGGAKITGNSPKAAQQEPK